MILQIRARSKTNEGSGDDEVRASNEAEGWTKCVYDVGDVIRRHLIDLISSIKSQTTHRNTETLHGSKVEDSLGTGEQDARFFVWLRNLSHIRLWRGMQAAVSRSRSDQALA